MSSNVILDGKFIGNLKLSDLLKKITTTSPPFDFDITELQIAAAFGTQSYEFMIQAGAEIDFGSIQLNIPTIDCDISVQNGKMQNIDIEILFQVGGDGDTSIGSLFNLTGGHNDSGAWTFTGKSLNPIGSLSLTEFLNDVLKIFSLTLPSSFPDLAITDLELTLTLSSTSQLENLNGHLDFDQKSNIDVNIEKSNNKWNPGIKLDYNPDFNLMKCIPLVNSFIDDQIKIKDFIVSYPGENGISFEVGLQLGSQTIRLSNQPKTLFNPPIATSPAPPSASSFPPSALSYPVQKAIGPLLLQKIGLGWQGGDLEILLDVSVVAEALNFNLIDFSVGFPLSDPKPENWSFNLNGIGLSYIAGPVEMVGSLIKKPEKDGTTEYDGEVVVKFKDFGLLALGSLVVAENSPSSLFIFAFLEGNIGGPGFFFVTGLSLGFGYNRSLVPPPQEDVATFPLVAALNDKSPMGSSDPHTALTNALEILDGQALPGQKNYIPEKIGECWIAAGVQFTSFELLNTNALLIVESGKEFELILLGKSIASLPSAENCFAYIELGLEVVFNPQAEVISASAVLSPNSFLFDRACHLTGGFAFDAWFGSNVHAGEFVLTLGGYHPKFSPPNYYPKESRIGFNWAVDSHVSIKGGSYFALTPSCMMGGGSLEAQFHSGDLRAWFTAYADFLIYWKPFHFSADVGVLIGASYRLNLFFTTSTFKVEVSATISLWGPPTGGTAHVNWFIISFTVSFGAPSNSGNNTVKWNDFATMLPGSKTSKTSSSERVLFKEGQSGNLPVEPYQLSVSSGLVNQVQDKDGSTRWLVRADEFTFSVNSHIPLTEIELNETQVCTANDPKISIRPMGINQNATSKMKVSVTGSEKILPKFLYHSKTGSVPKALWGAPVTTNPNDIDPNDRLLDGALIGLEGISAPSQVSSGQTGQIDIATAFEPIVLDQDPKTEKIPAYLPFPAKPTTIPNKPTSSGNTLTTISTTVMKDEVVASRTAVYNALKAQAGFQGTDGSLSNFKVDPTSSFEAEPLLGALSTK